MSPHLRAPLTSCVLFTRPPIQSATVGYGMHRTTRETHGPDVALAFDGPIGWAGFTGGKSLVSVVMRCRDHIGDVIRGRNDREADRFGFFRKLIEDNTVFVASLKKITLCIAQLNIVHMCRPRHVSLSFLDGVRCEISSCMHGSLGCVYRLSQGFCSGHQILRHPWILDKCEAVCHPLVPCSHSDRDHRHHGQRALQIHGERLQSNATWIIPRQ